MKQRNNLIWLGIFGLTAAWVLSGCAVWKFFTVRKEKPAPPKLLVLPFDCSNAKVSQAITKGFIENLTKKVQVLDINKFNLYIASYSIALPISSVPSALLSTSAVSSSEIKSSSSAVPADLQILINDLFINDAVREEFYQKTRIDYLTVAKAKEQILSELEFGNLETAETAEIKMLQLKTGEILVEESFKQGFFEIVAPDRIGSKFANKVNSRLKQIRIEEKERIKAQATLERKTRRRYPVIGDQ